MEDLAVPMAVLTNACSPYLVPVLLRWFEKQQVSLMAPFAMGAKQMPSLPFVACPQGDRLETYRELERILQGEDGCLTSGVVNRLIAEASRDMQAAQVSLFSFETTESSLCWPLGFEEIQSGTEMFLDCSGLSEVLKERLWELCHPGNFEWGHRELCREMGLGLCLAD